MSLFGSFGNLVGGIQQDYRMQMQQTMANQALGSGINGYHYNLIWNQQPSTSSVVPTPPVVLEPNQAWLDKRINEMRVRL